MNHIDMLAGSTGHEASTMVRLATWVTKRLQTVALIYRPSTVASLPNVEEVGL
jgi:hypothetical protein